MSGKLGWIGAYNRPKALQPISASNSIGEEMNSTCQSRTEREFKALRADNLQLKKDYDELNVTLKQLIGESSHEKFDERRINLLKLQIVQLERQVSVLSEAMGCRHKAMLEVENTMAWLADKLRSYISADIKGPTVSIARADLMSLVESSESTRIKLFKAIEGSGKDEVGKDLLLLNPFLGGKLKQGQSLSILDLSLDRMNYLNLRHVAQLESKLCTLYKDLIRVFEELETVAKSPVHVGEVGSAGWDRMKTTVLRTCVSGRDAADDLLSLSLLCPSSPWPVLKRPLTKQVPVDRVIAAAPTVASGKKQEEINHIIRSSIGVCNHHSFLLEKEKAVLKEELNFHRSTHDLQVQYTKSLFEAVRKGYGEFEESAKATIVKPIKNMLQAYRDLKDSASEEALRDFLVNIKDNEEHLSSVVEMFEEQNFEKDSSGAAAFSSFAAEFFSKLDGLVEQCQKQRDIAIIARKEVAEEQRQKDLELQQLIEDLEAKYDKQWNPVSSRSGTAGNIPAPGVDRPVNKEVTDHNCGTDGEMSSSRASKSRHSNEESKPPYDDPTVLRSYLYSENTKTCGAEVGSIPKNSRKADSEEKNKNNEIQSESVSVDKKPMKKGTKWKPNKEWSNDFSDLGEKKASQSESVSSGCKHKKVKPQKQKEWDNSFSEPQASRGEETTESEVIVSGATLNLDSPFPEINKMKKSNTSYEPSFYVANRALKLRRAGSISSLSSHSNLADKDDNEPKVEERKTLRHGPPEVPPKPLKPADPKLKQTSSQKRSSWR